MVVLPAEGSRGQQSSGIRFFCLEARLRRDNENATRVDFIFVDTCAQKNKLAAEI